MASPLPGCVTLGKSQPLTGRLHVNSLSLVLGAYMASAQLTLTAIIIHLILLRICASERSAPARIEPSVVRTLQKRLWVGFRSEELSLRPCAGLGQSGTLMGPCAKGIQKFRSRPELQTRQSPGFRLEGSSLPASPSSYPTPTLACCLFPTHWGSFQAPREAEVVWLWTLPLWGCILCQACSIPALQ